MALLTDSMRHAVERQRSGRVASRSPDGARQDAIHDWLAVWDDRTLAIAAVESTPTVRNVVEVPAVDVTVVDETGAGYRFIGTARVLLSGPTFDRLRELFAARGLLAEFEHVVFVDIADVVAVTLDGGESDEAAG